nr:acylamino-acid-releasing enzyme [Tanacetum cinerariifolium]
MSLHMFPAVIFPDDDIEERTSGWNALQTLLPQIHAEIREEFRTGSGQSDSGGNPPPVANAARNYEILHKRDDDEAERPDKRQKSGDRHQPTSQRCSHRNHGHNNNRHGSDRRGGGDNHRSNNNYSGNNNRETGVSSPTDLPILVFSSPGVPLRAIPTQFALRVDADTHESVVELLVLVSSVVKLAICRRIARRTPLRVKGLALCLSNVISEDSNGGLNVECTSFPNEVTAASLSMPSPSGSKLLAVGNPENDLATHLKILGPFQLEKEICVPQSMHGSMNTDGW